MIKELHNYYSMVVENTQRLYKNPNPIFQRYKFDAQNYQDTINNTSGGMSFINNRHGIKKDATRITFWNCQKKGNYANDLPDKNADTDTDSSRQSGSLNVTGVILNTTVMLQEGVNDS